TIKDVRAGSAAAQVGFQVDDVVLAANGVDMTQHIDPNSTAQPSILPLKQQAINSIGKTFTAVVLRRGADGQQHTVDLKGTIPANTNTDAPLGVSLSLAATKAERAYYTPGQAMSQAVDDAVVVMRSMVEVPLQLIRGTVTLEQARPTGIVGITDIGVQLIRENDIQGLFPFIRFAGLLSMILGLTNLLPIPALDGGRILFVLIEWIRGRRVDPVREQWVHGIGMVFLLALSAVIVVFDIIRPISLP
ncbi:MAG TPA: site-2 protease family protein, partial [Anaerolineae bacterium]